MIETALALNSFVDTSYSIEYHRENINLKENPFYISDFGLPGEDKTIIVEENAFGTVFKIKSGNDFFSSSTKEKSVISKFRDDLFKKMYVPKHWIAEGIQKPNLASKQKALKVVENIFEKFDLIPHRIAPTIEEGVYLSYEITKEARNLTLIIEVYNNLDIALIVSDKLNKEIIYSEDITELDFNNAIKAINKVS